jgi:biotin transport system substrate-specific component
MTISKAIVHELHKMPLWAKNTLIIVGASLILALLGRLAIPLPFTPVPLILQGSAVLLLGVLLGSKRAASAVALLLAQAAIGLPVLSAGAVGLAKFMGPTGGYIIGFLVAAYTVGKIIELQSKRTLANAFFAMCVGQVIIFTLGAAWLSTFVGFQQAILLGIVPFILGDLIKMAAGLKILQWMKWDK